jgi:hypothetical protein
MTTFTVAFQALDATPHRLEINTFFFFLSLSLSHSMSFSFSFIFLGQIGVSELVLKGRDMLFLSIHFVNS